MQNAKIVNNGMIMADEDARQYDVPEHTRASMTDPGQAEGPSNPLRSMSTMFRAINRHQDASGSDGAPGSAHTSPTQTHGHLPQGLVLPAHVATGGGAADVIDHLVEFESTRIADCLGGVGGDIQGFSYGDVPDSELLFKKLKKVPLKC